MVKCHCGKTLKPRKDKPHVFDCKCGCVYSLVIVKKSEECSRKERGEEKK